MNCLRAFLKRTQEEEWVCIGRGVVVDPATGENFDYELAFRDRRMAMELFRLVESEPEFAEMVSRNKFIGLLGDEMQTRCLNDYCVEIGIIPKGNSQSQAREVRWTLAELESALRRNRNSREVIIGHLVFRKYEGLGSPRFWTSNFGQYDAVGSARRILERILTKKNRQISMPDHEGRVLVVHWQGPVDEGDLAQACRSIDFRSFPNIERIYFQQADTVSLFLTERGAGSARKTNIKGQGSLRKRAWDWMEWLGKLEPCTETGYAEYAAAAAGREKARVRCATCGEVTVLPASARRKQRTYWRMARYSCVTSGPNETALPIDNSKITT